MQAFPRVFITKKGEIHCKSGHPWVFEGEVTGVYSSDTERTEAQVADGSLVNVFSRTESKPCYIGTGFYNSASKIRVRLISTNANDKFDTDFWRRRVKYALDYRRCVMGDDFHSCRLIFGEADHFPGLTVDLFEDTLVCQTLSLGMERCKDIIFTLILEQLHEYGVTIRRVYERCDVSLREKEGMEQFCGYWKPELIPDFAPADSVIITENGIKYDVDFVNGQKTGFFLDQKYNRQAAARLAKGKRVLDCFTHTGAFALNCVMAGAEHVTAVDISSSAIEQTRKNASMNQTDCFNASDKMDFLCADVFELLTSMMAAHDKSYDYIILDPPAFTKSSATVKDAYRGYKDINMRAMKCLPRGGYLATCSCSHFMHDDLFRQMLADASHDAGVAVRQIEARAQSPDHPILFGVPETNYLKFYLLQII